MTDSSKRRGRFTVLDGPDGVGKGVFLNVFKDEAVKESKRVFDVHDFWKEHNYHPSPEEVLASADVILTSEPTYIGVGRWARDELVRSGRNYSSRAVAEAFALDRLILYQELVLPALDSGIDVFQSRSVSSGIAYQHIQSKNQIDQHKQGQTIPPYKLDYLSQSDIMNIYGNAFCLKYPMDFLIIPVVLDFEEQFRRLHEREKQDNCTFEAVEFQAQVTETYRSAWFRQIFTALGVTVAEFDAGQTEDFSKQQARDFYQQHLRRS
ncbi:TPA: hypothetical protein HA241_03160 [Candidatus Woesearchaeota archaeon]|nr:hypothetical protein [Candidatus Woesearchaeota archaeon]